MKRTLTVILAILMMLFASGCYGNTARDGAMGGRAYGGNVTRGRAYSGAYDGLYRDANRSGFVGEGAHTMDGAMRDALGGTTNSRQGGMTRGHKSRRAHSGTTHGRTHHGATARNHQGHRPMVDNLEYLR